MLRRWAEVFKELEEGNASLCTGDSGWEGGRQSGAWRPLGIFKERTVAEMESKESMLAWEIQETEGRRESSGGTRKGNKVKGHRSV